MSERKILILLLFVYTEPQHYNEHNFLISFENLLTYIYNETSSILF